MTTKKKHFSRVISIFISKVTSKIKSHLYIDLLAYIQWQKVCMFTVGGGD